MTSKQANMAKYQQLGNPGKGVQIEYPLSKCLGPKVFHISDIFELGNIRAGNGI
jgi:hypothetical protein